MSSLSYRTSGNDHWSQPRAYRDESLRRRAYGRVIPMYEPSLLERLFGFG